MNSTFLNKQPLNIFKNKEEHPFHLVNSSLWPMALAFSLYNLFISLIGYFNYFTMASITFDFVLWKLTFYSPIFYLLILLFFLVRWFLDIIREATFEGYHTLSVQTGIYFGMILFIVSEIMFFFSFFWAFFHISLSPNLYLGLIWPPKFLNILDPFSLPLWNTIILLSSGVTVTYAHRGIIAGSRYISLDGLYWTVLYGFLFSLIQGYEYCFSDYSMNDGVFGSLFFLLTGFHGIHVIARTSCTPQGTWCVRQSSSCESASCLDRFVPAEARETRGCGYYCRAWIDRWLVFRSTENARDEGWQGTRRGYARILWLWDPPGGGTGLQPCAWKKKEGHFRW